VTEEVILAPLGAAGGEEGWLPVSNVEPLWRMARDCARLAWSDRVQENHIRRFMSLRLPPGSVKDEDNEDPLRKLRADTVGRIRAAAAGLPREVKALIVPGKAKLAGDNMQRIAIEPERIEFVGGPGTGVSG